MSHSSTSAPLFLRVRPLTSVLAGPVLLAGLLLSLLACGGGAASTTRGPTGPRPPVLTTIATVAEVEGQILVELPVGAAQRVEAGDLFRIFAGDRLKGMVQVIDIISEQRSLTRQVAISDRMDPLGPGDEARLVRDLSVLAETRALSQELRDEQRRVDAQAQREDAAFTRLREHYQRQLSDLERRLAQQLAALELAQADELRSRKAEQQRAIERLELRHRADLTALRASLTEEARLQLRQDRRELEHRVSELQRERQRLQDQFDAVLRDRTATQEQLAEAARASAQQRQRLERALAAEVETRQVLETRLAELEARLAGESIRVSPVLTADPERSETVLERLERLTAERDQRAAQANDLRGRNAHLERLQTAARQRVDELEQQIAALQAAQAASATREQQRSELDQELARLRQHADAVELSRLQAERAWLTLAGRVLRLPPDEHPMLDDLQTGLRRQLAADEAAAKAEAGP